MGKNVAQKLIEAHLVSGVLKAGAEIGLIIDQALMQDATGTMVMLEFEALGIPTVRVQTAVQYVDHNLLQTDHRNADDHLFLRSACQKFGIWYSRPGNGVSHAVHMECFGVPGQTMLGSDSHTCSAGAMGMFAVGAGGLEVALAMAGQPFFVRMPLIHGVYLTGELQAGVSAKDVILELLRRHGVKGGIGKVFEYYGPGLMSLSAMDRHTIANMGAELGATTSVFPSDKLTKKFLSAQSRSAQWVNIAADDNAEYDEMEELDLSTIVPMIALPGSPGNVVKVQEVVGLEIYQSYIGSSANAGLRDIAVVAQVVKGKQVNDRVSLDINPASRQVVENLLDLGLFESLVHAGARIHQAGCNGCIGMGQAPATGSISLRTVPRNFTGRSGTNEDQVYLCSPETAAVSALSGKITDPREVYSSVERFIEPLQFKTNVEMFIKPDQSLSGVSLVKGPNIKTLPVCDILPNSFTNIVLLKTGDNISTDDILPAGAKALPLRSNIPEISKFTFSRLDPTFYDRAIQQTKQGFIIVGGNNYGQGSSREHAALAPRYLGLRLVIAKSYARIHWQNLANYGIVPLVFVDEKDYDHIEQGDELSVKGLRTALENGESELSVTIENKKYSFRVSQALSKRQIESIINGSLINVVRKQLNVDC